MSVHYKFKAALDFSTVTFDGIHISVGDLKKEIIEQKRLGKNVDFDLQIQNAQSKEVYDDESMLIPKNTSVIVARIPIADKKKNNNNATIGGKERFASQQRSHIANLPPAVVAKGVDLVAMDGTEDEKIQTMMNQSTADYDPSRYMKIRGQSQHGKVPDNYTCFKCNQSGHWIRNCPLSHEDVNLKKSTGIPRSFMVVVDGPQVPGALITPEGQYAVPAIDHEAYSGKNKQPQVEPPPKPKIPDELICSVCKDLLTDALLVPCCANSYCDECIRSALVESEDQECPGCREKEISPTDLIPNRFLRSAVNAFKNETGYSKPSKLPEKEKEATHKEAQEAAAAERKQSIGLDDDLPDDLFPHSPRKVDEIEDPEASDSTKDLYDFNDGSIPSPFAKQVEPLLDKDSLPNRDQPPHFRGGHPSNRDYSGKSNFRGPAYGHSHSDMRMLDPSGSSEPPPPGFGGVSLGEGGPHDDRDRHGPFNPMQPPPGYGPPPGMHNRPPLMGGYQQGPYPGPGFNRYPPGGDMYGRGPPGPYPMDRNRYRDDSRGGPPRRSYNRDGRLSGSRLHHNDENIPGPIEDPLKEFERIMREKDRRKQMGKRRSTSRSPPPPLPRRHSSRSPSPFRKRSISPYARSPSPKRLRIIPKRRNSYSRSRSRTPPPLGPRRSQRSRSRSGERDRNRERERNLSPHASRRSPRRAPPYSPPMADSRYSKKDKDEYYDRHSRYDDRDRDIRHSRHKHPEDSYRDRDRDRDRYSPSGRNDSHRFDHKSKLHHSSSHTRGQQSPATKDRENRDKPYDSISRRGHYDNTSSVVSTGVDQLPVPSLLDMNIPPPGTEDFAKPIETELKKVEDVKPFESVASQSIEEKKEHKRRKSSEEKKMKKEKKKHKKEKKEEKKKEKAKRKKSKDMDPVDGGTTEPRTDIPLELTLNNLPVTANVANASPTGTDLEIKLTVPCDSTVKSPLKETDADQSVSNEISGTLEPLPESSSSKELPKFSDIKEIDGTATFLPLIPASKWDLDEDSESTFPPGIDPDDDLGAKQTKVPQDILKRAESAIFDKITPVTTVHSISVSVNVTDTSSDSSKKLTLMEIGTLPSVESKDSGNKTDEDTYSNSKTLASSVFRKPLKDRLGNKVSEDEAVRSKDDKGKDATDRDRDRPRDVNRGERGYRRRSKSRSPPTKRLRERSRSPRRDRDRERSRSPKKLPDLRSTIFDRPRSPIRDRDRGRDSDRYDRDRSFRRSRSRSTGRDRNRHRDVRRSRSKSPLRDDDRYRRRPPPPARSPQPLFPRPLFPPKARSRSPDRSSRLDRSFDSNSKSARGRSPINSKSDSNRSNRTSDKSKGTQDSGVGGVAAAFSNPFSDLNNAKKGKQRINIKLSSTSKLEKDSSSSSEEEELQPKLADVAATAGILESEQVLLAQQQAVVGLLKQSSDEESKKKKKAKKRKSDSSSSSSSSSSSDEKHKKKSKKSKKKKKKKKKSK